MSIRVLFFASLADITGTRDTSIEAAAVSDIGSVFAKFSEKYPALAAHRPSLLCALNSEFAGMETPVRDGDEIAFFPPVSGG